MPDPLVFHEKAKAELVDAAIWYEEQKAGLGTEFTKAVNTTIKWIVENPNHHSFRKGNYRGLKMPGYPYTIFYQVFHSKQMIHICSVHHNKRAGRHRFRKMQ